MGDPFFLPQHTQAGNLNMRERSSINGTYVWPFKQQETRWSDTNCMLREADCWFSELI